MKVKRWMTTNVVTVTKDKTVKQAAAIMDAHDIGTLIVVEERKPIGVFTERDILRQIIAMDINPANVEVGTFMTKKAICGTEDMDEEMVARTMHLNEVKRLPVVNETGELVGIVTKLDVLTHLAKKAALK